MPMSRSFHESSKIIKKGYGRHHRVASQTSGFGTRRLLASSDVKENVLKAVSGINF